MERERTNTLNVDELRNVFSEFTAAYDKIVKFIEKGFTTKINESIKEGKYCKARERCNDLTYLSEKSHDLGIHLDNLVRVYAYDKNDSELMHHFSQIFIGGLGSFSTEYLLGKVMEIETKLIEATPYQD